MTDIPAVENQQTNAELETQVRRLERARERERKGKERAEILLEEKSRQIYLASQELEQQNKELKQRAGEIELLHSITLGLRDQTGLRPTMQVFLDAVCQMCNWPIGHIYILNKKTQRLMSLEVWHMPEGEAAQVFQQATAETEFKINVGLPGTVWASGEPTWIEDVFAQPSYPRSSFARELGIQSGFGVPIKIHQNVIAVSEFYTLQSWQQDDNILKLVETAAIQLGLGLERHQAERRVKKNYAQLKDTLSQLQEAQAHLVQAGKMAGLGELSAGIAHEINTPVGYVMSNVNTLARYLNTIKELLTEYHTVTQAIHSEDEAAMEEHLHRIEELREEADLEFILEDVDSLVSDSAEGMVRVKEIIDDLRNFARTEESEMQEADINEGIEATLKMVWNELKYKCEVHKNLGDLPPLVCYPGQLNQVFLNLLKNAGQAIPEQGEITVETQATDTHIIIRIADTGTGISPENMAKLFDPFFTTKSVGEGTGLGLSISHGIIQKHQGTIEVESALGKGTTFTIQLPLET